MGTADEAPLQVRCLGRTEIIYEGEPLSGTLLRKAQALLVYLALEAGRHQRDTLAGLLWSDMPDDRARANLRTALSRMPQPLREYLDVTHRSIAFDPTPGCWIDVVRFEQGLSAPAAPARREALTLYQGDFLSGLTLRNAPLFEEWALIRREQLRGLVLDGLFALAETSLEQGAYARAIADLRRLLTLDPWREAAHRALMRALAATGDRAAALAQFEQCRQTLADDLDVEPAPATAALYEQINTGEHAGGGIRHTFNPEPSTFNVSPPTNLPAETTPFVGRQAELAQIAELLSEPGCRLLTVFGPGGAGKTRLALQTARRATDAFADGVYFVDLEPVESADQVAIAVADALNVPLSGRQEPRTQLLAYVLERELLLVLDNFEHLLPETDLLIEILERAPDVKLLVTSREVLNLYEEWVLEIQGLRYPGEADVEALVHFDAVALFLQRARQVNVAFDVKGNERGVFDICRLLQGMPLGIELAAAWVRTIAPAQIAREIAADLGSLAGSARNVPARHRSMVAVFDYSWQLLRTEERQLLRRLTVFRGGFTATAAREVLDAAPRDLSALADKALLQVVDAGRYDIHPLIRQFAAEKMAAHPDKWIEVQACHAAYYAGVLGEQKGAVTGQDQQTAFRLIARELGNVRAAWSTAIATGKTGFLDQMIQPLYHFFRKRGLHREGFRQFGRAVDALRDSGPPTLLARLLVRQGRLGEHISQNYEVPHSLLTGGLTLARRHRLAGERALALDGLGLLALMRGKLAQAAGYLDESLEISTQAAIPWLEAGTLVLIAWLRCGEGRWEEAEEACKQAVALHRQIGDESGVASALTALGNVYDGLNQYREAEDAYAEALALCRRSGHRIGEGQALTGLFTACYHQGELARAATYARDSLAVSREVGDRLGMAIAYHNLGFLAASDGRHREAVDHYRQTLAIYATMDADGTRYSNTHRHLAESLLALDETAAAGDQVYQAIQRLPVASYPHRGPDLLLTSARLLAQRREGELAAGILAYLRQHALLPDSLELPLSGLLDADHEPAPASIGSIAAGLAAVQEHLGSTLAD